MSISEWGKGALVAAFAGSEDAFHVPSGTPTEQRVNPRSEVRPSSVTSPKRTQQEFDELLGKRVVLAIGVSQGRNVDETDDSTHTQFYIRRAGEVLAVGDSVYRLWLSALVPQTVDQFETRARQIHGSESDPLADARELESLALIAIFGPDQTEWNTLAAKLRPIPLGFGLGNSEGDVLQYEISDPLGRSMLRVHPLAFWIWLTWDGTLSIGQAADELAPHLPAEVTRDVILRGARELVLSCISSGLIVLDAIAP
jgi:hypothetical protein